MMTCPQCKKTWQEPLRQCPTCQSDLSLLADFLTGVESGLSRAATLLCGGELGSAVKAYLEVLEVDPDNATARRRVAEWARAVRHFDRPPRKRRRRRRPKSSPPPPAPVTPVPPPALPPPTACPLPPPSDRKTPISVRLVVILIWGVLALVFGMGFLAGALWGSHTAAPAVPATVPQD